MTQDARHPHRIRISEDRSHFVQDGRPFFYLADTVWAAFANLPEALWPDYLAWRRRQGFTAVQISILPVAHDASNGADNLHPFEFRSDRVYDFSRPSDVYFDKARRMVAAAVDAGILPVLGVLWKCYVPGTNAGKRAPFDMTMPLECVVPYTRVVCERFGDLAPFFFISGDTEWNVDHEVDYYMAALDVVRGTCPDALLTLHLATAKEIPDVFIDKLDFYMYQSGHRPEQTTPYELALRHAGERVARPVVNGEPCYEGHGKMGTRHRHTRYDVRKAIWQSLLAGARAGVAYGGHGVWSCHLPGMDFMHADRKHDPYPWDQALRLPGSWDAAFARWIWEDFALHGLAAADLLVPHDDEIRVAATPDRSRVAVYSPFSDNVALSLDLAGYDCRLIDLSDRTPSVPHIEPGVTSLVRMNTCREDALLLARKR